MFDGDAERGARGFKHRLRQRGMRVHGVENFVVRGFQLACRHGFGDELRGIVPDDVAAQELAIPGIVDYLYKAACVAGGSRLSGGGGTETSPPSLHSRPCVRWLP